MIVGPRAGAGRGLRASLRPAAFAAFLGLALALMAACDSGASGPASGGADARGSAAASGGDAAGGSGDSTDAGDGATGATGDSAGASGGAAAGSGAGSGTGVGTAVIPDRIGSLELKVVPYRVPSVLDEADGRQLATMLGALDLPPAAVSLVIAVDREGRLAIGRWELPGRGAEQIGDAWREAAGTGWRSAVLAGEAALTGRGPDGSLAWAVARDGVFVYVVTDDQRLAEEAVAGTR